MTLQTAAGEGQCMSGPTVCHGLKPRQECQESDRASI